MKEKTLQGGNGVSSKSLKRCKTYIGFTSLTNVGFESLREGLFPDTLKLSIVKPCSKKGNVYSIDNYRPITLISVFSIILEKVIHNRLINFLDVINVLVDSQHGFKQGKSTGTAAVDFVGEVISKLDQGLKISFLYI